MSHRSTRKKRPPESVEIEEELRKIELSVAKVVAVLKQMTTEIGLVLCLFEPGYVGKICRAVNSGIGTPGIVTTPVTPEDLLELGIIQCANNGEGFCLSNRGKKLLAESRRRRRASRQTASRSIAS
jgi:hypothetical protein